MLIIRPGLSVLSQANLKHVLYYKTFVTKGGFIRNLEESRFYPHITKIHYQRFTKKLVRFAVSAKTTEGSVNYAYRDRTAVGELFRSREKFSGKRTDCSQWSVVCGMCQPYVTTSQRLISSKMRNGLTGNHDGLLGKPYLLVTEQALFQSTQPK